MAQTTTKKEKEVVLVIADISGYTKFMINNKGTLEHAQMIITKLMNTVIKHVQIPLKISKFEGDAVFFYAVKKGGGISWEERKKRIRERLGLFVSEFTSKVNELAVSNTCSCNACSMIEKLRLKVVVHTGKTLFYKIDKFYELSGTDVILVHRMLKNSLVDKEYIMYTENAYKDLEFDTSYVVEPGFENLDDIGAIITMNHYPHGKAERVISEEEKKKYSSAFAKFKSMMSKMATLFMLKMGLKKKNFTHIPAMEHNHQHEKEQ